MRHALGHELYLRHELGIANEICNAIVRQAGLACAEQLTRPTQLEVTLCDDKAIVGVTQNGKT
jgi:hypothetical protein